MFSGWVSVVFRKRGNANGYGKTGDREIGPIFIFSYLILIRLPY